MTRPAPTVTVPVDTFNGDNAALVASISALLETPDTSLSARVPGMAKQLLASAAARLTAAPAAPQAAGVGALVGQIDALLAIPEENLSTRVPYLARELLERAASHLRAPSREPEGGAEWFGVTGAADEIEALAVALFAVRCPGVRMTDEDLHYYSAAAQRAIQSVSDELDAPALATREVAPAVPDDVQRLVDAARVVAFEDQGPDALKALDVASEAFADRVPWENEPIEEAPALENPDEPSAPENARDWTGEEAPAEAGAISNQTPEWRAVTSALSGYRVAQAPYMSALSAADIIGLAKAILTVHPPVQTDSSMQAMARSSELRAIAAEQELEALRAQPQAREARHTMTLSLSDAEMTALEELIAKKDLDGPKIFRDSFKLYQAVEHGAASVTWTESGPLGLPATYPPQARSGEGQ